MCFVEDVSDRIVLAKGSVEIRNFRVTEGYRREKRRRGSGGASCLPDETSRGFFMRTFVAPKASSAVYLSVVYCNKALVFVSSGQEI